MVDAVEGFDEEVPLLVDGGLFLGDATGVHQRLDEGVILRQLLQSSVPEQVRPRVPDVGKGDAVAFPAHCGDRRTHPAKSGESPMTRLSSRVLIDGIRERGENLVAGRLAIEFGEGSDGRGARQFPRRVPTHAVRHNEHVPTGVAGVLVALAHESDVRAGGVTKSEANVIATAVRGARANDCALARRRGTAAGSVDAIGYLFPQLKIVRPTRSGAPGSSRVGPVMRVRSIQVPLVLPTSSTIHRPSFW